MRKLTKGDIENIIGRNIEEFRIEAAQKERPLHRQRQLRFSPGPERLRPLCHMAIPSA